MYKITKVVLIILLAFFVVILAMGIGSVHISPINTINIIFYKLLGYNFLDNIEPAYISILWKIRFPRVLLAFFCGSGLAVSGAIIQSILKNPLASPYTLGVSSGASLGASLSIIFNINFLGIFTLQFLGFFGGILTVFLALFIASKIDKNLNNNSVILMGMAFSLFTNAMLSIIISLSKEDTQSIIFWQMGSFASKKNIHLAILIPVILLIYLIVFFFHREMDIMTFGEEQAKASGVYVKKVKWILISCASILTGFIISISGVIGFIDLFTPHISRKVFGASHKFVLPITALLGGIFMVICDLIARTIVAPIELPIGAITSFIGAPFFIYLYFSKRKKVYD